MLSRQRQMHILAMLEAQQAVAVADLARHFGVSEVTIRRDLRDLEQRYGVERIRGGAFWARQELTELSLRDREIVNLDEKRSIGRAAAELVNDGDTIIIGGGTTTVELARNLGNHRDLVVITPALNVAYTMADCPDVTVIVTGGIVLGPELTMAGHFGEQTMRALHADKLFLGSSAFDLRRGLMSMHPPEIGVNRAMIEAADRRIVLIDHSKFNRTSTCCFARVDEVDCVVTDDKTPDEILTELAGKGIQVIRA